MNPNPNSKIEKPTCPAMREHHGRASPTEPRVTQAHMVPVGGPAVVPKWRQVGHDHSGRCTRAPVGPAAPTARTAHTARGALTARSKLRPAAPRLPTTHGACARTTACGLRQQQPTDTRHQWWWHISSARYGVRPAALRVRL
jgi:hypothetical protein